jgi:hypothetical protein
VTPALRRALLSHVLDTLIPASGGFPAAGAVALDHILAVAGASPDFAALLSRGLDAVEEGAPVFASLSTDDREALLRRVESAHAAFFEALVRHTYDGYYSHPTVLAQLGLDPGPIHPRGHRIAPADLPDLSRVTARGPLYRLPPTR